MVGIGQAKRPFLAKRRNNLRESLMLAFLRKAEISNRSKWDYGFVPTKVRGVRVPPRFV